jgi:hypothetical protein
MVEEKRIAFAMLYDFTGDGFGGGGGQYRNTMRAQNIETKA